MKYLFDRSVSLARRWSFLSSFSSSLIDSTAMTLLPVCSGSICNTAAYSQLVLRVAASGTLAVGATLCDCLIIGQARRPAPTRQDPLLESGAHAGAPLRRRAG